MPDGRWILPRQGEEPGWPYRIGGPCGCACYAAHPGRAGICDVKPVVTVRRYRTGLFRAVRVPLCGPCSTAQRYP